MGRNPPVPIVNTATRAANFQKRDAAGNDLGAVTLEPGETYYERGVNLTYETLVLRNSSGIFTKEWISMDDLAGNLYEKIEVTYDSVHDFRLVKHTRRTWIQKFAALISFKPRSRGETLPT